MNPAVLLVLAALSVLQPLDGAWQFRQARGFNYYPAEVPGTVHTDLMRAGVIEDPFIGFGERAVQWVDKEDWIYRRTFDLDPALGGCSRIDLCFDGLDTYADVTLNGTTILKADNMFRRWRVQVDSLLKPSGNLLEVYFHSPVKLDMPKWEAYPVHYDPGNDQSENGGLMDRKISIFARKSGYHYGWDWGPRIVTAGIWRPVRLEGWNEARIADAFYHQLEAGPKLARLEVQVEVEALQPMPGACIRVSTDGVRPVEIHSPLAAGSNLFKVPVVIEKPRLWWTLGLGTQELYGFRAELLEGGRQLDARTDSVGLRSLELVREKDAAGCSFRFDLNGSPVFMKGANYIPNDIFLPRVGPQEYARVIDDAKAAGMNMLRVWGGGVYESDLFYTLCDRAGILVWQDFMFSCSIYPYEGAFRQSVMDEAEDNVRRLRNHPCLALWCGNNECSEMWYGWGVQSGDPFDRVALGQYNQQYYKDLPSVVERLSPGTPYTPTSPWSPEGARNMDPMQGDFHYWAPWAQRIPSSEFERHHSRFYSEYGFQSFAGAETLLQFARDTSGLDAGSEMVMFHQRGGTMANQRIMNKLADEYKRPSSFGESIYLSQIAQGDIIRRAIESHRRDKPLCWGSLVWQINDCWPVASWSGRDWYGNWKPLHYYMRDAFRDILPSAVVNDGEVDVWLVSDRMQAVSGVLDIFIEDFEGRQAYHRSRRCKLPANSSQQLGSIDLAGLGVAPERHFVRLAFTLADGEVYTNMRLLSSVRDARLPKSRITTDVTPVNGGFNVSVSSDCFARGVFLNVSGGMLRTDASGKALPGTCSARNFSDNYFDLPAGTCRTVFFPSEMSPEEFGKRLTVTCLTK